LRAALALDHCVIAVSDWDRSNAFYCDVLGAELVELEHGRWAYRFGEQQLNVHGPGSEPHPRAADPVRPGNSDLCFRWEGGSRTRPPGSQRTVSRSSSARSSGAGRADRGRASTSATPTGACSS
jgi:catechol 2,3-dioxygenase-like lactoylglutathione lyase family enzyme